jgi:hypothetical protein
MAKSLFPSRKRGPGRAAQRVKPGDIIRGELVSSAKGVSIGDCHRKYTQRNLEDWQNQQITRLVNLEARLVKQIEKQVNEELEKELARQKPPETKEEAKAADARRRKERSTRIAKSLINERSATVRGAKKRAAFIARKETATAKIMARKRAPGNTTYENFSKFFHFLLQAGYVAPLTTKDFVTGKVTKSHGEKSNMNVEPPVLYRITNLGDSTPDWNNPRKGTA